MHINISYLVFSPTKCMSLAIQLDICNHVASPLPGVALRGRVRGRSVGGTRSFGFSPSTVRGSPHPPEVSLCHRHGQAYWPPLIL